MSLSPLLLPSSLLPSQLLGIGHVMPGGRSRSPNLDYVLGDPGRPAEVPTLLIAIFDNSGSVTSPVGTDPLSNRFLEVQYALSAVARKGSRHELGAIVHFDHPTTGDVDPTPIIKRGLARLHSGLRIPPDGAGSSELRPSRQRAVDIAEAHPDHLATVVVLSDFMLADPDPGSMLSELTAFPGQVHAVVLGVRLPEGVLDERVTVTHVGRQDRPGAVARALFASLTTHRPGSRCYNPPAGDGDPRRLASWIPQHISRRHWRTSKQARNRGG